MRGKQTKQTLRSNVHRSREKGAVIHSDVCGPMSVSSFSGARYFVSSVDEYSGFVCIVPIAKTSDVAQQFKLFKAWWERKHECNVKRLCSDNGR